jgi:serine/threonine protein phosphatase PrpC
MRVYRSFAVTVTGGSHKKHGKGCEDSSFVYDNTGLSIAVVTDGHGDDNCFRSAKGSQFAVDCAVNAIKEFVIFHDSKFSHGLLGKKNLPVQEEFSKAISDLVKHIIAQWQVKVEEDCTVFPFTEEELKKADGKHRKKYETDTSSRNKAYGSTLIAAAITKYYWFGIHIGDGRFTALYPDGTFDQPIPWDDKCYLNVTTSICDDDAYEKARCYFSYYEEKTPPVAVFLCSDGIDDNYPVDENEKHLFKLYRTIALTFAEDGFDSTFIQLKDLATSFATKGKGDDTSIAGFIDMETLKNVVPIWQKQIAEEEAATEKSVIVKMEIKKEEVSEKSKQAVSIKALDAIEAYNKNMGGMKGNITDYGGFVKPNQNSLK